jgi:Beta/Gamma crystallin
MMKISGKLAIGAVSVAVATTGFAQTKPAPIPRASAVIYRDGNFSGPAVAVDGARDNLALNWQVRSVRVDSGSWEACTRPNFAGRCFRINASNGNLPTSQRTIQSMRPVYPTADGWKVIGERSVADRNERDVVPVWGRERYREIKICVDKHPVRFRTVAVRFRNGEIENVPVLPIIGAGDCTRDIRLQRAPRDIASVEFYYETTSLGWESAEIRILAR